MAAVFEAEHAQLGARRAVKVLLQDTPDLRARFEREAHVLAKTRHPGVVRIHAVESEGSLDYLVLDLVEGSDLEARLRRDGVLPVPEVVRLGREVATALAHVHGLGLVHRDLKPANVLLQPSGEAVLTDFGIARDAEEKRLTASGALVGTPHYMAPEQVDPRRGPISGKSDVFALGALLHELLCGRPAFQGATMAELVAQIVHSRPPPPSASRGQVPRGLDRIVARCLEKDADLRPDAAEVAAALTALAAGDPDPLAPASGWRQLRGRLARREAGPVLLVGTLVGLALLTGVLFLVDGLWLAPRREAAHAWREHETWRAMTLGPHELELAAGGDVAPLPREALLAQVAILHGAAPYLNGEQRAQLEERLADVAAHLALLDAERGPRRRDPAHMTPSQLLVDALLLTARDRAHQARSRLAARTGDPTAHAARLLELRLTAQLAPAELPGRLLALDPEGPAFPAACAIAAQALPAWVETLVDQALQDTDVPPSELGQAFNDVARAGSHTGLGLEPLVQARRTALAAGAAAWSSRLRQACERGDELAWLERLGAVITADPQVRAPDALLPAFDALLERLGDAFDRATESPRREDWISASRRLFATHTQLKLRIHPPLPSNERLRQTGFMLVLSRGHLPAEIVVGCLRVGALRSAEAVAEKAKVAELEDYVRQHPNSRAARFCQALVVIDQGLSTSTARMRMLRELETIRGWGQADLEPSYQGEIDLYAARMLLDEVRAQGGAEVLLEPLYERTQRARQSMRLHEQIYRSFEYESEVATQAERPERIVGTWRAAVETLAQSKSTLYGDYFRGRASCNLGLTLAAQGQLEAGEALCRAGVEILRQGSRRYTDLRVAFARLLRLQGRLDEAAEYLFMEVDDDAGEAEFVSEAVLLLVARDELQRARAIFERGLRELTARGRRPPREWAELEALLRER
jgi:hypothetical protein